MKIDQVLSSTNHRPWPIPKGKWSFYQEWNKAIFLHWQVDIDELKKFVPKELEIDLLEGKPWVSLVAFTMENIRPKVLPAFPPISNFDEINIRTYVRFKGKSGVHFLSIEAGKMLSCKIAKGISELPYRFSKINRTNGQYVSKNNMYDDTLEINYSIKEEIKYKQPLDLWLTERYALFQDTNKGINAFDIHHIEWPLYSIKLNKLEVKYERFCDLFLGLPDKIGYSSGVQVISWGNDKYRNQLL